MSAKPFDQRVEEIPASFFSCDINGSPVDAYIARYRAVQVASEADALVADLLEALKRSVAAFEGDHIDEIEADYGLATAQRVDMARTAIAKATGDAS